MRAIAITFLAVLGCFLFIPLPGITVAFSGESFGAGEHQVVVEYCYSRYSEKVLYAIVRSWPKNATVAEKTLDPRVGKTFYEWRTVRDNDGSMVSVGTAGTVYFFDGNRLKTMRVSMTESDDTAMIGNSESLDEVWDRLQQFRAP